MYFKVDVPQLYLALRQGIQTNQNPDGKSMMAMSLVPGRVREIDDIVGGQAGLIRNEWVGLRRVRRGHPIMQVFNADRHTRGHFSPHNKHMPSLSSLSLHSKRVELSAERFLSRKPPRWRFQT